MYEFNVPPGYAAFAEVQAPDGFVEVSRIFDLHKNELIKVFFEEETNEKTGESNP